MQTITNRISPDVVLYVVRSLRQKKIPYITTTQFLKDVSNNQVYVLFEDNKPVAMCSVIWDSKYNYWAIKRLVCFKKRNNGKGYANLLISYCANIHFSPIGCTPWVDNKPMRHLLEKNGFKLQYIFDTKWCFYRR